MALQSRPTKAASTWSRTGCATCKRRRKKCDQGRPACHNCIKRHIRCEGYQQPFVWQSIRGRDQGEAAAGPHTGQVELQSREDSEHRTATLPAASLPDLPWQQMSPPVASEDHSPFAFIPEDFHLDEYSTLDGSVLAGSRRSDPETRFDGAVSPDDGGIVAIVAVDFTDCLPALQSSGSQHDEPSLDPYDIDALQPTSAAWGSLQSVSAFPQFTGQDFYYIQYFHEQGAKHLLNVDAGARNPLRCILLPRAVNSSGLLHAMCAVAACHRAQRSDPDIRMSFSVPATSLYVQAASWLRTSFDRTAAGCSNDDASLFTALLLCKYEIIQGSVHNWSCHLHGLEKLVDASGGVGSLEHDCGQYIDSFLRYHRTVASIANAGSWIVDDVDETLEAAASPSMYVLDSYSGCSYYILRACRAISKLAASVERREIRELKDLAARIKTIVTSLGTANIELDAQASPDGVSISQIGRILFVAQRIRYSAFVFLHSVLEYAQTQCNFSDPQWQEIKDRIPYTKMQAMDGCMEMLAEIPAGEHCEFAALTLPLFLTGCETEDREKRYLILDRLFLMETSFAIGNISRARDALMAIWRSQRESKNQFWWKVMQDMGWELLLS